MTKIDIRKKEKPAVELLVSFYGEWPEAWDTLATMILIDLTERFQNRRNATVEIGQVE